MPGDAKQGNNKGKLSDKNVKKDIEEKITGYAIDKFSLPRYHLTKGIGLPRYCNAA